MFKKDTLLYVVCFDQNERVFLYSGMNILSCLTTLLNSNE